MQYKSRNVYSRLLGTCRKKRLKLLLILSSRDNHWHFDIHYSEIHTLPIGTVLLTPFWDISLLTLLLIVS